MNKITCQYAIVRFAPFIETGEFANVGIVLIADKKQFFGFQLEEKKYTRITHFFDKLEAKVYLTAIKNIQKELERVADVLNQHGFAKRNDTNDVNFAHGLFNEIIRPRETIIKFGKMRTVLTDDPEKTLKELFGYYVQRDFVDKEYQEALLVKGVRKLLVDANAAKRFKQAKIGNDIYHANFPFVEKNTDDNIKIIKPLYLGHDDPCKLYDHGATWMNKITRLRELNLLDGNVLFTVQGPRGNNNQMDAFNDITSTLRKNDVDVVAFDKKQQIIDFVTH